MRKLLALSFALILICCTALADYTPYHQDEPLAEGLEEAGPWSYNLTEENLSEEQYCRTVASMVAPWCLSTDRGECVVSVTLTDKQLTIVVNIPRETAKFGIGLSVNGTFASIGELIVSNKILMDKWDKLTLVALGVVEATFGKGDFDAFGIDPDVLLEQVPYTLK